MATGRPLMGTYHDRWEFLAQRPTMLTALIISTLVVSHVDPTPTRAAACSAGLAKIERQIAHLKSDTLEGPTATQTLGARLHHQPNPAEVKSAERKATDNLQTALAQARAANSRGDAAACDKALMRVKEFYGVQ
jgi:hypothetical protein